MKNKMWFVLALVSSPALAVDGGQYAFDVDFDAQEYVTTGSTALDVPPVESPGAAAAGTPPAATDTGPRKTIPAHARFFMEPLDDGRTLIRVDRDCDPWDKANKCDYHDLLAGRDAANYANPDRLYVVKKENSEKLDRSSHLVQGVDHGLLLTPFKFRVRDQSISGQSSIGYYVGSQSQEAYLSPLQVTTTTLISLGLTQIDVTDPTTGATSKQAGASTAVGAIYETRSGFQFGWLLGWDFLSDPSIKWEYQASPWVSVGIGFGMMDRSK